MKKTHLLSGFVGLSLLGAGYGHAADLARRPVYNVPPPPPQPVFSWTGFYIGGHMGWGWQHEDPSIVSCNCGQGLNFGGPPIFSYTADGFLGGLQAGYNWQFAGPWVLGIEGDFTGTDMKGENLWTENGEPHTLSTKVKWIGDVTGRLGYAFDTTLLYAKGGWVRELADYEHTHLMPGAFHDLTGDIDRNGWLVGLGVEHAFWPNITAKIEWNYIGLNSNDVTVVQGPLNATFNVASHVNIIKTGLNYKF